MTTEWVVLVFAVLTLPARLVEACSCMATHPQTGFCNAHFVIKATIQGRQDIISEWNNLGYPDRIKYTIHTSQVFKETPEYNMVYNKTEFFTGGNGALCGIGLDLHSNYLLMGGVHVGEGIAYVSLCDFVMKWSDLSSTQRSGVHQLYGESCDCIVQACSPYSCNPTSPNPGHFCSWQTDVKGAECYWSESLCTQQDGSCQWQERPKFNNCIKRSINT